MVGPAARQQGWANDDAVRSAVELAIALRLSRSERARRTPVALQQAKRSTRSRRRAGLGVGEVIATVRRHDRDAKGTPPVGRDMMALV